MTASIYSMPISSTVGIAHHYFISSDGTFENSIGWGPKGIEYQGIGAELTPEQEQRACEYPDKFGQYNIHSNNCEMFAWYVMLGRRYSQQTQDHVHTKIGSLIIGQVQPVLKVNQMEQYQWEQAIAKKIKEDLEAARKIKLQADQVARDEFWRKRDAGLI